MASTTHTVITTGGGDYLTLNAYEDAIDGTAYGAGETATVNCSGIDADTTAVNFSGWDADVAITINGNYAVTSGAHYSTSYYRLEAATTVLTITANNTTVNKIQTKLTAAAGSSLQGIYIAQVNNTVTKNCVMWQNLTGSAAGTGFIYFGDAGESAKIFNCVVVGASSTGNSDGIRIIINGTLNIWNCTVSSFSSGIKYSNGPTTTMNIVNSAVFNNVDDFNGTPNSVTYTASDDTEAGTGNIDWANGSTDWDANFVDPDNADVSLRDFHLKSDAPDLIGTGLDDPGSGAYSNDLDGESRTSTWDIGADEYVAAGGETPPPYGYLSTNKGFW